MTPVLASLSYSLSAMKWRISTFRASGIKFNAQGEHSDLLSHATAKAMCDSKPQAELVEWAGIGHAPSLLEPAQIDLIAI